MKIAIILGSFSTSARPMDFNNIWSNSRGLTGTDLAFVMLAKCLAARGHEIHAFTIHSSDQKPYIWEGVNLHNFDERFSIIDDSFTSIISISEPDVFMGLTDKPLRVCWQFLNDFTYCNQDSYSYVDKFLAACNKHKDYLKGLTPSPEKWGYLGLGCTPDDYEDKRVPGRVVWCSSADRGLHLLLQAWPQIRSAVPDATLKIFYHFGVGEIDKIEPNDPSDNYLLTEMAQRVRYIKNAIKRLKNFGVEHIGSISRDQMKKEFSEASVLGYPCDTVSFSEGFSVTILEAHASFTVPVITNRDCLGEVYGNSGALIVKSPVKDNLQDYTELVIKSLTDKRFADSVIDRCRVFAWHNTWDIVAAKMEGIIKAGK